MTVCKRAQTCGERGVLRGRDNEERVDYVLVTQRIRVLHALDVGSGFAECRCLLNRLAVVGRTDDDATATLEIETNRKKWPTHPSTPLVMTH